VADYQIIQKRRILFPNFVFFVYGLFVHDAKIYGVSAGGATREPCVISAAAFRLKKKDYRLAR
jgi:hypothetical protein